MIVGSGGGVWHWQLVCVWLPLYSHMFTQSTSHWTGKMHGWTGKI